MMSIQELVLLLLTICSIQLAAKGDEIEGNSLDKRAPGWGKRDSASKLGYLDSVLTDLSRYEMNDRENILDLNKRRPGWGKRSFPQENEFDLDKRKPGWGKRSSYEVDSLDYNKRTPGWGKRSYEAADGDTFEDEILKRKPGWGKRNVYDDFEMVKRRPGWGKRSPGWGKRSDDETSDCPALIREMRMLRLKLAQQNMREEKRLTNGEVTW